MRASKATVYKVIPRNSKVVKGPTILFFAKGMLSNLKTWKGIFNDLSFASRDSTDKSHLINDTVDTHFGQSIQKCAK